MKKAAFTLIELVISIVIIGLTVITLPLMLQQATQAQEFIQQDDMIFKAMTVMNDITSKYWDNTAALRDADGNGSLILDAAAGDGSLSRAKRSDGNWSNYRVGSFLRDNYDYRKFYDLNISADKTARIESSASAIPSSASPNPDAVEQYNGYSPAPSGAPATSISVKVCYVDDNVALGGKSVKASWTLSGGNCKGVNQTTNLKQVVITVTRGMDINFTYFTSNIGSQELKSK